MLSFLKSGNSEIKPMVLLVLDGWGSAPASEGNAITLAETPNMDNYKIQFPYGWLIAAGESVGLPANEAGNSEVGHLTIGAGRVIYQSLPRINMAIEEGDFFDNRAFLSAIQHTKDNNSKLHIMGLVSSGSVHSSNAHLYALLELCRRQKNYQVLLHLFTDGRDAPPSDGIKVIEEIETKLEEYGVGKIATISGRYYALDRDGRWDRTKLAYDALIAGSGLQSKSALDAVKDAYRKGKTDEFIEPTVIVEDNMSARLGPASVKDSSTVDDNDAVIFFNFRIDRPRQLTMAFVCHDFEKLKSIELGYVPHEARKAKSKKGESHGPTFQRIKWPKNVFFVTMTEYQKNLPVSAIAFPPQVVNNCLTELVSKNNMSQLHLAESEKEHMVTFYFDGMKEEKFSGEEVEIIPSPSVATYDKKPEMSVRKIVSRFKKRLRKDKYHFFMLNFANPDMVAHSGSLPATIKAIEVVDKAVGELVQEVLARNGTVVITADHGNAEELLTYPIASFFVTSKQGSINTEHSNNPVPIYIINKRFQGKKLKRLEGSLADVAPTILAMMGMQKPQEMIGKNLLEGAKV